ncbi:MAG: hypothetical protein NTX65_07230 [Ignavibacteriales bacterium]|nr:hypothetical protein [Ignavibacteriales bacterium]
MKKFSLLLFFIPVLITSAQNLDSLYNRFMQVKGITQSINQQTVSTQNEPIKCSFGIVAQVRLNYDKFTALQKKSISKLLDRPLTDTSFVSPKNKFRIHFNKAGNDVPGYDLNELAKAADSSYNYEVNILGYLLPPKDSGKGGDDLYDIYIQNLASDYGYTQPEDQITNLTYTSYMVIDNDYSGNNYYTHGINGGRVTVAHEFHHAIQIGNYGFFDKDVFYHEITSTAMEEFVFNDINDYYFYIDSYFRNPQRTFSANDGYNLAIWNIFLRDRFGVNIIKRIWELMRGERALKAIADAIIESGSTFKAEFNTFGLWTYFTDTRAVPNKYFKEASNYHNLITPLMVTDFTNTPSSINVTSEAVSNNFLQFNDNTTSTGSVLVSLISNCDINGGITSPVTSTSFVYTLSSQPINNGKKIIDGYYSKLESQNGFLFSESNILNDVPISEGQISTEEIDYPFPQPFRYSTNSLIYFPTSSSENGIAELYIYSVDMTLVYSITKRILVSDKIVISWDAHDKNGNKLATEVYIYVTKSGDKIKKGKFVIYND